MMIIFYILEYDNDDRGGGDRGNHIEYNDNDDEHADEVSHI